ncbi:hypothetical protein [Levilactobacillus brevis]|uniref:hypothetical protein n=1 Tax=Levilactobacillus brevis TaxID=1580 RepID=UPI003EB83D51
MTLLVGNKEVTKILIGTDEFSKINYEGTWLECPDEGIEGQDFKGKTIMKWDAATNVATFKSNATVDLPSYYTPASPASRLAITLPKGFRFLDNGTTATFYGHYSMLGIATQSAKISVKGDKLYCQVTNNYQNSNPIFLCKITSDGLITFDSETTFKVEKI